MARNPMHGGRTLRRVTTPDAHGLTGRMGALLILWLLLVLALSFALHIIALRAESLWRCNPPRTPPSNTGIRFLATEETAGSCQVCGKSLDSDVVTCVRCRTPHHADCFRWTGVCSTFACRSHAYRTADGSRITTPEKRQTPDEWLDAERARDHRESGGRRPAA